LVLSLLLLAGGIAVETEQLVSPLFRVKVPSTIVTRVSTTTASRDLESGSGQLLVRSSSSTGFGLPSGALSPGRTGISVGFALVADGSGPYFPNQYSTNSTGVILLTLKVANYSALFYDLPMNFTVPVQIHANTTTYLDLALTARTYGVEYLSLPAGQGNVVPPWSRGTAELRSAVSLYGSTAAFLDIHYRPGSSVVRQVESPLLIMGTDVRASSAVSAEGQADQWVGFQTLRSISLVNVTSVDLSVFSASTSVTMYPMNSQTGGILIER